MGISEILTSFIKNWQSKEELYFKLGTASDISEEDFTFKFTPIDEGAPVENVRMKVIEDSSIESFIVVPSDGSKVVVGYHYNTVAQCLSVERSEKVIINTKIHTETSQVKNLDISNTYNLSCNDVKVLSDSWVFNNGGFGGLIKIASLESKLNELVSELNEMKNTINSHKHTGGTLKGLTGSPTSSVSNFTDFNKNDFENTKIKH